MRFLDLRLMGRVQGVGLRTLVFSEATRRNLGGWAGNEEDGSVRVHLEGEEKELAEFARWLSSIHDPIGPDVRSLQTEGGGELQGRPKKPFAISPF
ncbi:MAG: acylphosphatase [Candidatus Marsarchaeota archaeon]|nr:acylphosphatase [Candidatus Marsarchaeota archaeon]